MKQDARPSGAMAAMTFSALALAAASGLAASAWAEANETGQAKETKMIRHPYVGMWMTDDGRVRHELLPGGRYDEARGNRQSAYQGRYEVDGTHIEYWDDTGFTADGDFVDENTLHHGGMILRRQ